MNPYLASFILILFNMGDCICFTLASGPAYFKGWWIPGSGYYALLRWGKR